MNCVNIGPVKVSRKLITNIGRLSRLINALLCICNGCSGAAELVMFFLLLIIKLFVRDVS